MHEFDEGLDSFRSRSVLQKSWTNSVNASVVIILEQRFGSDGVKLALERRFGCPAGAMLALEWRFRRPYGGLLALERRLCRPYGVLLALERRCRRPERKKIFRVLPRPEA